MNLFAHQLPIPIASQYIRPLVNSENIQQETSQLHNDNENNALIQNNNLLYPQQNQQQNNRQQQIQPTLMFQSIFFYLYFLQGIVLSFCSTMPYIYKQLPSYDIMAIFSMAVLPFSFKFLIAPIIQKYNNVSYGKRKTWIVISQICTSFTIFVAASYTSVDQSRNMAVLLFLSVFWITFQDIALDGLAIKQLKIPHVVSMLQTVGQTMGSILGSLILLKLTSDQFAISIGFQEAISSPNVMFHCVGVLILIPTIFLHFFFKETILHSEIQLAGKTILQVIKRYTIFINTNSRHFRTSIIFLIWYQGFNFFAAGYQYELINSGFSRNTLNTISNAGLLPIGVLTCVLSSKISQFSIKKSMYYTYSTYMTVIAFICMFFPQNAILVSIITILLDIIDIICFLSCSIMISSFPVTSVTGMYLTMLACTSNFGQFRALHTKLLGVFGWRSCSVFGLIIQGLILYKFDAFFNWIQQGSYMEDQQVLIFLTFIEIKSINQLIIQSLKFRKKVIYLKLCFQQLFKKFFVIFLQFLLIIIKIQTVYQQIYSNLVFFVQNFIMHPNHDIKPLVLLKNQAYQQKYLQQQINTRFDQIRKPSKMLILMFLYTYLIQGIIVSFGATMPYIYAQLPNYKIMSIFTSVALPFSFKFITAPFTEKINFIFYGKRKTWIIIGQISTSFCLYLASYYTHFENAYYLAVLLISSMFFISLQDISLDGLALKQLRVPHLVSMISTVGNILGTVFGSLLLLKLTSEQFAQKIGLENPITEVQYILKIFSVVIFISTIMMHYFFKETILQSQLQLKSKSLFDVIRYYKVFINPSSKYFRLGIFFITYYQGFNFFNAGYDYELIKHGFSRDIFNTLNNIIIIPISAIACIFSEKIQKIFKNLGSVVMCCLLVILVIRTYFLISFPVDITVIGITMFFGQLAYTIQYITVGIMINELPVYGVSGMLLTVLASATNFGEEKGFHTILISKFGWKICASIGIFIQLFIILIIPTFYKWIQAGTINLEFSQKLNPEIDVNDQINKKSGEISQESIELIFQKQFKQQNETFPMVK